MQHLELHCKEVTIQAQRSHDLQGQSNSLNVITLSRVFTAKIDWSGAWNNWELKLKGCWNYRGATVSNWIQPRFAGPNKGSGG